MMPTCEHRWCHKTAEKVIEVYYSSMDKRTSAFADRCVFLCKRKSKKKILQSLHSASVSLCKRRWRMSGKITRERFDKIKKFLETPVRVKPSIRYVAECFGYLRGTVALINRFDNFVEYKKYQTDRQNQYTRNYLENELNFQKAEAEAAKKEFDEFNSEWFFGGEDS